MSRIKQIAIMAALVLVLVAIFQNTDEVAVRFLFAKAKVSLVVVLLATFLVGTLAGYLAASLRRRGRGRTAGSDASPPRARPSSPAGG